MAKAFQCDKCKQMFLGSWAIRLKILYGENGSAYPHDLCSECAESFSEWLREVSYAL